MFYLDVADVAVAIHICCKRMFVNTSVVLDVYCSKCFMLQVLHDQAQKVGADGGGPLVRAGSEAGVIAPHASQVHATAVAGEARPVGAAARGQVRQQRVDGQAGAACMRYGACLGKVGGGGAVRASLPLAACIQVSAPPVSFPTTCRGSVSGAWASSRRGHADVERYSFFFIAFKIPMELLELNLSRFRCLFLRGKYDRNVNLAAIQKRTRIHDGIWPIKLVATNKNKAHLTLYTSSAPRLETTSTSPEIATTVRSSIVWPGLLAVASFRICFF